MSAFLFFIFLFINTYNPISPYLTVVFDIVVFIYLSKSKFITNGKVSKNVIIISYLIMVWSIIVVLFSKHLDLYVLIKYMKVFLMTVIFHQIMMRQLLSTKIFLNILSAVLFSHVLAIFVQYLFPSLIIPMAKFFDFGRIDILDNYSFRLLGFGSSYDVASLISILAMVLFLLKFKVNGGFINLFLAAISYLTTIKISRTGMLVGSLVFVIFLLFLLFTSKLKQKIPIIVTSFIALIILSTYILPLLVSTSGLFDNYSAANISNIDIGNEYGSGSAKSLLSGVHVNILNLPFSKILIGFGTTSEKIIFGNARYNSDIGYLEVIAQIGIVGLFLILSLYFLLFKKVYMLKTKLLSHDMYVIRAFILLTIVIMCVMNYKLLILYGRGTHDLLLILFYYYIFQFNRYERFKTKDCNSMCEL